MAEWYFKTGSFEIPTPSKFTIERYPISDLIRIADYSMTGMFIGVSCKFGYNYDEILHKDVEDIFENLMGWDGRNAWQTDDRKLIYRYGDVIRSVETYTGAMSQEFHTNFMGAESPWWIWKDYSFALIQKNAIDNEIYSLGNT